MKKKERKNDFCFVLLSDCVTELCQFIFILQFFSIERMKWKIKRKTSCYGKIIWRTFGRHIATIKISLLLDVAFNLFWSKNENISIRILFALEVVFAHIRTVKFDSFDWSVRLKEKICFFIFHKMKSAINFSQTQKNILSFILFILHLNLQHIRSLSFLSSTR